MRHAAIVTSILLTLMSGFVLSRLWALEPVKVGSTQAVTNSHAEETALAFYQAVNAYLASGDDASLRRMLHPGFATHQAGSSSTGTPEDFLHHLNSVRQFYPGIQLEPDAVSLGNNIASVTLSVSNPQMREFAGIEIDPVDVVGRLDVVRIERGLIIERWSSAPLAGQLDAFPALSIDLPFSINMLVARVQEVPLEGASEPMINHVRHLLLIVESGEAFLDVTSPATIPAMVWRVNHGHVAAAAPVDTETTIALNPMEAVYLPAGTEVRVWGSSQRDAALIALEFGLPMSRETASIAPTLGMTLWSGIELEDVGDHLTVSFGHATLLPQSTLSSRNAAGLELALVTGGSLDIISSSREVRVRKAGGTRAQLIDSHALLQAGEAAAAGSESDITYQVSGDTPATAWFFSLVPTNKDEGDATPNPTPAPRLNPTLS